MKFNRLAYLLTLSVAVGCGAPKAEEDKAAEPGPVAVEVTRTEQRPIRSLLEVTGSYVATQGGIARLSPAAPGRLVKVLVREGDAVRKGQLLAMVDSGVQNAQRTATLAGAEAARQQALQSDLTARAAASDQAASVQTAEAALRATRAEQESAITQAKFNCDAAESDLVRIKAGARPQEIVQAQQATVQARVARDRANQELTRTQGLVKEGFASRRQLEEARAAAQTADSALRAAHASESLTREGARPEERRAAEVKMAAAKEALASAEKLSVQRIAQAETALRQAKQAALGVAAKRQDAAASSSVARQREAEAAAAQATAALTSIVAPFDGKITRRALNPGDFADTTSTVLEISGSGSSVDFVASVPVVDAEKVRAGMEAELDEGGGGRVLSVSPGDTLTGLSSIRIATGGHKLAGSFSRVRIVLARYAKAVAVPKDALVSHDGKSVLFRVEGETAKQVEVKTGAQDGDWVQIVSGIAADTPVVRLGQYELADGSKIKPSKGEGKD